jgi:hypothetical protein
VIVLSDGCFTDSEKMADDKTVELRSVGTRAGNVGITNFQVRRSLLDPIGYEILTEVTNASSEEVQCRLEIDLNDSPVDVIPLTLAPEQTWSQTIEKTSVDGGQLVARIKRTDALPVDNTALAILPQRKIQRVVLVSDGNLFLRKALEVNPLVDLKVVAALPAQYDPAVLYVFHRHVPEKLPPANVLVIDAVASTELWKVGEELANPIVVKQDPDSPLMRHVRLDNVLMPAARQITPPEGAVPLVTALSGDPLYFSLERGGRKLLVLTVNLDQGDLTFRTAFPIMVTNALGWFAGSAGELRESLPTGAVTEIDLPSSDVKRPALPLALFPPTGTARALPPRVTKVSLGPFDQCGIWQIAPQAKPMRDATEHASEPISQLACNLASRRESDLRVPQKLLDARVPSVLSANWFTRPIWFYLLAFALIVSVGEWFLYQRRWIS